ncbi:MAG TPA: hypothetical protein DCQ50_13285 [Chryseobacterium sp.]|nr:hypothetical protein [Chryseobacterium sp.]
MDGAYQAPQDKPIIKIAKLVVILPALGFFIFGNTLIDVICPITSILKLKIHWLSYTRILCQLYISTVLSLMLAMMVPIILQNMPKQSEGATTSETTPRRRTLNRHKGKRPISKFTVYVTVITVLCGLFVLLRVYHFDLKIILVFLILGAVASYIYF